MPPNKVRYEPLETGNGSDIDVNGPSHTTSSQLEVARTLEKQARIMLFISAICVIASACFLFGVAALKRAPTELECAKVTSPYSTIWDAVEFWEGDLVNFFNHSTIYRGPPTLEREEAWDWLWNQPVLAVDAAGLRHLNRTNPEDYYPVIGSDPAHPTYGGVAEVFHQLHCLNVIRRYTWPLDRFDESWGRLYPGIQGQNPVLARMHVDHCIEALRLALMCYSDITPVMTFKVEGDFDRNPDFNVHHKCRNFDKIVAHVQAQNYDIPPPPSASNTSVTDRP